MTSHTLTVDELILILEEKARAGHLGSIRTLLEIQGALPRGRKVTPPASSGMFADELARRRDASR